MNAPVARASQERRGNSSRRGLSCALLSIAIHGSVWIGLGFARTKPSSHPVETRTSNAIFRAQFAPLRQKDGSPAEGLAPRRRRQHKAPLLPVLNRTRGGDVDVTEAESTDADDSKMVAAEADDGGSPRPYPLTPSSDAEPVASAELRPEALCREMRIPRVLMGQGFFPRTYSVALRISWDDARASPHIQLLAFAAAGETQSYLDHALGKIFLECVATRAKVLGRQAVSDGRSAGHLSEMEVRFVE